jgi:hypothetical protein
VIPEPPSGAKWDRTTNVMTDAITVYDADYMCPPLAWPWVGPNPHTCHYNSSF